MLSFRLSHGDESSRREFDKQLKNFLLRAADGRYRNTRTQLNATLESQRIKLLDALRHGEKVRSPRDIEAYFPQRYIRDAFYENQDRINWDVVTTVSAAPEARAIHRGDHRRLLTSACSGL